MKRYAFLLLLTVGTLSAQTDAAPTTPAPAPEPHGSAAATRGGEFSGGAVTTTNNDYVLSPNDVIEMSIFREPDVTTRATLAQDGTAQLPFLNEVKLGGLTVREAREKVRRLYNADYFVEPQVNLSVVEFSERKFTIIGQVTAPGSYKLEAGRPIELLEAIGLAGGFTRVANQGAVSLTREVGGKATTYKLNAKKDDAQFKVIAGDVIKVGESWW